MTNLGYIIVARLGIWLEHRRDWVLKFNTFDWLQTHSVQDKMYRLQKTYVKFAEICWQLINCRYQNFPPYFFLSSEFDLVFKMGELDCTYRLCNFVSSLSVLDPCVWHFLIIANLTFCPHCKCFFSVKFQNTYSETSLVSFGAIYLYHTIHTILSELYIRLLYIVLEHFEADVKCLSFCKQYF